jgi:thiol peroxidase
MAQVMFKGNPVSTSGSLPQVGTLAPDFKLVKADLSPLSLSEFKGKRIILNIFPSIDTPVCANSVRRFNVEAAKLNNTVVLCISRDLPFAQKRFCAAEGIANVVVGSEYRNSNFSDAYGVRIVSGPLEGLFSRTIVVIDEQGKIIYADNAQEISEEPDYEKALAAAKG